MVKTWYVGYGRPTRITFRAHPSYDMNDLYAYIYIYAYVKIDVYLHVNLHVYLHVY